MIVSLALVLLCAVAGTTTTYLYDQGASFGVRVATGSCVGLSALGLIGFIFASLLGLTPVAIGLTALALLAAALIVLRDQKLRETFSRDLASLRQTILHPTRLSLNAVLFLIAAGILWRVFSRAVIGDAEGLYTGVLNNFGDLPFHLSVITSFAFGNNYPPEDPTYAGVTFTYPFLTDFISAIFVRCGAGLRESMFIENIVIAVSLVTLIYRWAWEMLRDRLAATLTPFLVLLNGGLGWSLLWTKAADNPEGLLGVLNNLPPSFTIIPETTWRWGNAISTLLIPQRGILLGLALAVIVFTQWWMSEEVPESTTTKKTKDKSKGRKQEQKKPELPPQTNRLFPLSASGKRMVAAGVIAGLIPITHAHTFVVVMMMGACIALLRRRWADWFLFFLVASVIALPQMWWSTHGSAVDAKTFFEWKWGWDRGEESAVSFWLKNTGFFIPLLVIALLWRGKDGLVPKRLLSFYLPFLACFIIPNSIKMAPWIWDNIKVLYYWWLASAPLVALLLSRLWRMGDGWRPLTAGLVVLLTLAGALDVAAIALRSNKYEVFDITGMRFAELIKQQTQPRSLIIHAPVHNTPVFLSGRRSLMGYPGHIWTHGLEHSQRESEIRRIYAGGPDAGRLLEQHQIDYAVVGPHERNVVHANDQFFSMFQKVGEIGEYQLYKIEKQ